MNRALTVDMVEAVAFYQALGFHLLYGGEEAPFTSFRVGAGYLNLQLDTSRASDGQQLEGELIVLSGRYEVGGVVFDAWEIEELEDLA